MMQKGFGFGALKLIRNVLRRTSLIKRVIQKSVYIEYEYI